MARRSTVLWIALALVLLGYVYGMGSYPLFEPDEGRNAEVAREMAMTNEFVLPRFNGLPYLDKPVLYFAAGALSIKLLGTTELAARLPSLLFTLLTLAAVSWMALVLFGREGTWIALLACAATPFTLTYARVVIFDSALTLFITVACCAFYLAIETAAGRPVRPRLSPTLWSVIAWSAVALGVLTKGPVALLLPVLVALPYAAWQRHLRAVVEPAGILTAIALILPWVLAMEQRVPGFLRYVVVVETAERLFTDRLNRSEPLWYFLPILFGAAFPWTVVLLAGLRRVPLRTPSAWDRRVVYLVLWIVLPLVFFSLSHSKRPQYVLPLVPAIALLVAYTWTRSDRSPGVSAGAVAMVALGVVLIGFSRALGTWFDTTETVRQAIPATALLLGGLCLAGGGVAGWWRRHRHLVLLAWAVPVASIPVVGIRLLTAIAEDRSAAGLVTALQPVLKDNTELVAVGTFPLSLPFYANRRVFLATDDASELTSNYIVRHVDQLRRMPGSPLRAPTWWLEALALCDRPRIFLVPSHARALRQQLQILRLLGETRKVAAYGPCGPADLVLRSP